MNDVSSGVGRGRETGVSRGGRNGKTEGFPVALDTSVTI
jgi:hypothetical protein